MPRASLLEGKHSSRLLSEPPGQQSYLCRERSRRRGEHSTSSCQRGLPKVGGDLLPLFFLQLGDFLIRDNPSGFSASALWIEVNGKARQNPLSPLGLLLSYIPRAGLDRHGDSSLCQRLFHREEPQFPR